MNQSVLKALSLLDLFTKDQKELSLSEISKKAGMTKPTAYRLLSAMEEKGFLRKIKHSDQDIRYCLGLKLLELGHLVSEQLELRNIALPHMEQLRDEIDEIVHLAILDGTQATYIEKVESKQALRLYTRIGKSSSLYIGSGPKLLFAYMPEPEREKILRDLILQPLTKNTHTDKNELRKELQQIRNQGYSVSNGEQDLDTTGISFPIKNFTGKVVAALTVSGPSIRFCGKRKVLILEKTNRAADRISKDLGYQLVREE